MKSKLQFLTAALLSCASAEAVTLSLGSPTVSVLTNNGTTTSTANPASQVVANGTVTASASALVLSNPGGLGNFQLVDSVSPAVFASATINRPNGGGGPVAGVSAETTYQVAFILGLEEADVSFDLNYDLIENKALNGLITWSLVGPTANTIFSGTIGTATTTDNLVAQSITQQTAHLTGDGIYTFTLKGIANQGGTTTVGPNSGVNVNFNSINFSVSSVTPVPEPSITLLSLAGLGLVLGRRRRH